MRLNNLKLGSDVLFAPRLKENRNPDEVYSRIESMFNGGDFFEIFERDNNFCENWTTLEY